MKQQHMAPGGMVLCLALLTSFASCNKEKTYEGTVETMLEMGGITEEGLQFTMRNTFQCPQGTFELILSQDCDYVGFDRQKEGEGFALDLGGKSIVLHSAAVYKVRGEISDPAEGGDMKRMKAAYFELVKPGVGKSTTKAGF